jgi:hypothetical protein
MRDYFVRLRAPGRELTVRRKLEAVLKFGTVREALSDAGIDASSQSVLPEPPLDDAELDKLWEVAREHAAQSEPEHEIGDLQDLTRLCWRFLSDEQRQIVAATLRDQVQASWE